VPARPAGRSWNHASFEHRDLDGAGAREAFARYVDRFPQLTTYGEKTRAIDGLAAR
jgi:hypothetical protein